MSSAATKRRPARLRRIGWIVVEGGRMAPNTWVDKAQAEAQARAWETEFSVRGIYAPKSSLLSPRSNLKPSRKP